MFVNDISIYRVNRKYLFIKILTFRIIMSSNNYQLYRATTIGEALKETLDEFTGDEAITEHLAKRILLNFDRAINKKLAIQTKNKQHFKVCLLKFKLFCKSFVLFQANKLKCYRLCDNVWTLVMVDVEIKDHDTHIARKVQHLKIVACDGSK